MHPRAVDVNVAVCVVCAQCQTIFISHEIYYQTPRSRHRVDSAVSVNGCVESLDSLFGAPCRSLPLSNRSTRARARRTHTLPLSLAATRPLYLIICGIVINAAGGICRGINLGISIRTVRWPLQRVKLSHVCESHENVQIIDLLFEPHVFASFAAVLFTRSDGYFFALSAADRTRPIR